MTIGSPDLSGLGNQDVGPVKGRLLIGAGQGVPKTPLELAKEQLAAEHAVHPIKPRPSLINHTKGGRY